MTSFSFSNVTHKYGVTLAVQNFNLGVNAGETICLLGPSGSGKTTILRLLAGIEQPTDGEIYINNHLVSDKHFTLPLENRNIGFLFQDYALFPHMTVMENVLFGLYKPKSQKARNRAIEVLTTTGMMGFIDTYPDNLSGGEQQRVALARALAPNPNLILMDEPFSSLDLQLRDHLRMLILDAIKNNNLSTDTPTTNVIVTHDPEDAMQMADKIAVILDGKIVQYDTPQTVYDTPKNIKVANLLGHINHCKYEDISKKISGLQRGIQPQQKIALRPHAIKLESSESSSSRPIISGNLTDVRQIGSQWRGRIQISPKLNWDIYSPTPLPMGVTENSVFSFKVEDLMIFDA